VKGSRGAGLAALVAAWLATGATAEAGASVASLPGTWLRYALPGAEVKSLIAPKGVPGRFVLGTAQGGIYHSTDGGRSWQGLPAGLPFPGFTVSGLAVDPASPSIVWAALTGVVRGGLLARTDDDGVHWSEVRRWPDRAGARVVAVTELFGRRVVAVGGDGGVEISVDDGESWRLSEPPLDPGSGISFLAFHPSRPELLFAGSFRHPFVSSDLGRSWRRIASGMIEDTEVFDIDFSLADPNDLWAATCGWVYRTLNAGRQWVRFKEGLADRRTHAVRRDPRDGARVLAGTTGGLFESLDDGRTFHRVGPDTVVNTLTFDPSDPSVLLIGTEADGVLRSEDGGRTLRESNAGLSETRVSAVVTAGPGRAVVARAADGRSGGLWSVDLDSGRSAKLPHAPPATIVAMAALGGRLYAGTSEGLFAADGTLAPFRLLFPRAVRGLLVDAGQLFAATSDGVVTSTDGGKSWDRVGSLSGRIDGLFRVRLAGGATVLAARARGVIWYRDRADWSDAPGALSADGPHLLAGGFGRAAAPSSRVPQTVGVEVDAARGQLVFRGDGRDDEAVLLPVPENGLTVSDWAGDPRTADGLLLATIGRGLFRFVPRAEPAAAPTVQAPRRMSPSARR
jgi:photosystem II stability/assembly factor-like uncharacterized protein